ncbi:phosphoglycolate phosphatase [Epibacterium ulvae]|uniref:phosphoglycolate phosphatase n=1 Tax=Epibacterium ulvae TaxID=1156985 RepID=A0A1G5R5B1_9RHOB|nr:HAD family hydrolase [Epibacterium ulvae]SCZ69000.1 phosphoglycolate phosphatase [Epibacterium ulvae]
MAVEALLFDKDGTLFDFAATWNRWSAEIIRSLAQGDQDLAQILAGALQFDLEQQVFLPESFAIAGTNGEVTAALLPHLPAWDAIELERYLAENAARAPLAEAVPLAPFLDDLLARGLALGVMTNDSEHSAFQQLDRIGVRERFAFVAGYDSGFGAKPDASPLLAFAHAVDVAPECCAMVGDSRHDLIAGHAAGMQRVAVLTGPASASELAPFADVVLDNIGEIPAWMSKTLRNSP